MDSKALQSEFEMTNTKNEAVITDPIVIRKFLQALLVQNKYGVPAETKAFRYLKSIEKVSGERELISVVLQVENYKSRLVAARLISDSLTPVYKKDDEILVDTQPNLNDINVGDLIVFRHPVNFGRLIMHYVVKRSVVDGRVVFRTSGTNPETNPTWDDWEVYQEDIEGKALLSDAAFALLKELRGIKYEHDYKGREVYSHSDWWPSFEKWFGFKSGWRFDVEGTPSNTPVIGSKSSKQSAIHIAHFFYTTVKHFESQIARHLCILYERDLLTPLDVFGYSKKLKNLAKEIYNSHVYKLPRLSLSVISTIIGIHKSTFYSWNRGDRSISLSHVISMKKHINHFYSGTIFISSFERVLGSRHLPSGLFMGPFTEPGVFLKELKKHFIDFESGLIHFLEAHPNQHLPYPYNTITCQDILDRYVEYALGDKKSFKLAPNGLISAQLLGMFIGLTPETLNSFKRQNSIIPSTLQKIDDYVMFFFGESHLETDLLVFKLELDSLILKDLLLDKDFLENELFYEVFPFIYQNHPDISKNLFSNLLDVFKLVEPSQTIYSHFILTTIVDMLFGESETSWHRINELAQLQNLKPLIGIGDWIMMIAKGKLKGTQASYLHIPYVCKICGKEHLIRYSNLQSGFGCPRCSKSKSEKITGAMLEVALLKLIDLGYIDYKSLNIRTGVPLDSLFSPSGHAPFSPSLMEYDFNIKFKFKYDESSKEKSWTVESDGVQHRTDGVGFLAMLGIIAASKRVSLSELTGVFEDPNVYSEISKITSLRKLFEYLESLKESLNNKIYELRDVEKIKRLYLRWLQGTLTHDDYKTGQFHREDIPDSYFLSRVPTNDWRTDDRATVIVEEILKLIGNKFSQNDYERVKKELNNALINSNINWDAKIRENSVLGFWSSAKI